MSVKSEQYWYQNGILDQFNEWQPNWLSDQTSAPVDVSKIADVPMSFFVATLDEVCPAGVAKSYIGKMKTQKNIIDVSFVEHMYFAEFAYSDWFMEKLLAELVY